MILGIRMLASLALGLAAAFAAGQDPRAGISIEPVTFPATFLDSSSSPNGAAHVDQVLEASGVMPIGDGRLLLVAHDKKVPLRVVETATGRQIGAPITCDKFPAETPKSSKWEAMASDSDGNFYLAGSHSGKTEDERQQHARLIRFRLKVQPGSVAIDEDSVVQWRLAGSLVAALQHEGLTQKAVDERKVEGLAIRERVASDGGRQTRELIIGLRQPDDLVRAFVVDITKTPAPDAELPLTRLFAFEAGLREGVRSQLTSLEYLPAWKGFLAVTASEDEQNAFHGNTLWFVPDARIGVGNGAPIQADQVGLFEVAMKAEGLCVMPDAAGATGANTVRLLITYDNDAHSTHIPSRFQIVNLVRHSTAE